MLYEGAGGNSRSQLNEAFNFPTIDRNKKVKQTLGRYNSNNSNVTVRMGNGIFLNNGFNPKQNFTNLLGRVYDAEVTTLPASDKVTLVNQWISNKTEGLIEKFLSEGSINKDTQMLLINAIYFHGVWAYPFQKEYTRSLKFYTDEGRMNAVDADFMEMTMELELVDLPGKMQMVSLPYMDKKYAMNLYLPVGKTNIHELADDLFDFTNPEKFRKDNSTPTEVRLIMPKFDITSKSSLVDALEQLNITDIFNDLNANLSGISDNKNLKVGDILHAATIKVDEEGSEAAAATSIGIDIRTAAIGPNTEIILDRPFLFSIVDNEGVILFSGKIMNPTKKTPTATPQDDTTTGTMDDTILLARNGEDSPKKCLSEDKKIITNAAYARCEQTCLNDASHGFCISSCYYRHCV